MRRITLWVLSTVAALVLLFSYRTSTMGPGLAESSAETSAVPGGGTAVDPTTGTGAGATPGPAAPADGTSGGAGTGSFDGSVAQTRFGPVQVRIVVSGGKITDVQALQFPNGNHHDQSINSYALPILRDEALAAQSANIDSVSGATFTSDGYRESLQAAIDAAHLG